MVKIIWWVKDRVEKVLLKNMDSETIACELLHPSEGLTELWNV